MSQSKKLLRVSPSLDGASFSDIAQEKIVAGEPSQKSHNVFTNAKENFFCGVWESTTGIWNINYTEDEFCYMIEGKAILTDSDGLSEEITPGQAFVIPAGYQGTWETIGSAKKFYSVYEDA